jgi:hypothetical protein
MQVETNAPRQRGGFLVPVSVAEGAAASAAVESQAAAFARSLVIPVPYGNTLPNIFFSLSAC